MTVQSLSIHGWPKTLPSERCKPLVLHLRGASNKQSFDILLSTLHLVRKACLRDQPIHLHCFTSFQHDVEEWLQEFPNCYFGFTGKVSSFSSEQLFGLQSVPAERLLIQTDSPYIPVHRHLKTNTHAYIGDVAHLVARAQELAVEDLLAVTLHNSRPS